MSLHLITGYAGKKHVTASDQGSYNMAMMGNGQFVMDRGNKFAASILTNNTVRVLDGDILMQGRHIRQKENTYEDLNFDNGTQGMKRHDLIVVRYTKDASTGIEGSSFVVIKGTPSEMNPADPEYIVGDITEQSGDLVADMPLFRVVFEGLTLTSVVPIFKTINNWDHVQEEAVEAAKNACDEVLGELEGNIGTPEEFAQLPDPGSSLAANITAVNSKLTRNQICRILLPNGSYRYQGLLYVSNSHAYFTINLPYVVDTSEISVIEFRPGGQTAIYDNNPSVYVNCNQLILVTTVSGFLSYDCKEGIATIKISIPD